MPEDAPGLEPPPLSRKNPYPNSAGGKKTCLFSWGVILVSVIFLAWTASFPESLTKPGEEPEANFSQEANELALLKLQSRFAIGVNAWSPVQAEQLTDQLDSLATGPRSMSALAIVYVFLDETKASKAEDILLKIEAPELSSGIADLVAAVRKGLENGVNSEERNFIAAELGWFASLVRPREPDAEFGKDITQDSKRTLVVVVTFIVLAFFVLLTGAVLLAVFLMLRLNGSLKMNYEPGKNPQRTHLFLEAFAVYIGIMALGHLLGVLIDGSIAMVAYAFSFLLALVWPVLRGCPWKQTREMIGWNRGKGWLREIGAGIVGYTGIVAIAFCGLMVTGILMMLVDALQGSDLDKARGADGSHPIVGMLDSTQTLKGQLFLLFFAAGLAPFLEETMFRGALFRYLRQRRGFLISAVAGGVIFAVIHPQGLIAVPALAGMGIGFALLREWRDSLIAPMIAHAINNGAIVILLLLAIT